AAGVLGWPEEAPFDRILVTAGGEELPRSLLDQLGEEGLMLLPLKVPGGGQRLFRLQRRGDRIGKQDVGEAHFVPLVEEQA
ncbi:MAG: protein-L-isoaspartate O-methyltransferase, partial [Desulfohalobiaceae bacterium]|nr:protein-L-isoaspartate O-methyltransferase [Desulfohalobiaceae bacterium]